MLCQTRVSLAWMQPAGCGGAPVIVQVSAEHDFYHHHSWLPWHPACSLMHCSQQACLHLSKEAWVHLTASTLWQHEASWRYRLWLSQSMHMYTQCTNCSGALMQSGWASSHSCLPTQAQRPSRFPAPARRHPPVPHLRPQHSQPRPRSTPRLCRSFARSLAQVPPGCSCLYLRLKRPTIR